ncbi:hypothetical protein CCR75_004368 [Bremia lactucae]|uniref:Secreted protein n=1 Tax=Bremia lactucae TaxID=4779 RepID=A0A976FK01_BRELC|nr:hypothetical protein CCR75_004368 [Bremia lactucae]
MPILPVCTAVATMIAAIVVVLAEQEAHIKISVHEKFFVSAVGKQCAFNSCVDPTVYPCAKSQCVRYNYTYGVCQVDLPEEKKKKKDVIMVCPYPNPYSSDLGDDEDQDNDADE